MPKTKRYKKNFSGIEDINELLEMVDLIRYHIGKNPIEYLTLSRKLRNNKNGSKISVQKQVQEM